MRLTRDRLRSRRPERGSVLILVPTGFLVMILLASIAFDLSLLFLRQRQASSLAHDLANDLATLALDEPHLRASGTYRLDGTLADSLGRDLALSSDLRELLSAVEVVLLDDDEVQVTVRLQVDYVFARALPGARDGAEVVASAVAEARSG